MDAFLVSVPDVQKFAFLQFKSLSIPLDKLLIDLSSFNSP
jgi:hypothetical protein